MGSYRLMLYEPVHTGHHFPYLARMLPGFLALPAVEPVLVTTERAVQSQEFTQTLAPFADRIAIETLCTPPPRGTLVNARHRARELSAAVKLVKPDHICILYADGLWPVLWAKSIFGGWPAPRDVPVEGWVYRGGFADPQKDGLADRVRRMMFRQLLHRGLFARLHLDDELLFEAATRWARRSRTTLVLTPNPVLLAEPMERTEARQALRLPNDGRLLVSTGMIAAWKGMDLLLAAFDRFLRSDHAREHDRLLLAGPHSDGIKQLLAEPPYRAWVEQRRIVTIDRFLDEQEMFTCAAAGDLTAAVYPKHSGRSSIILWAAAAGRPSLGTDWGCIGHVIRQQRLGITAEHLDAETLARRIEEGLNLPWTDEDAARVREYARFHSIENYRNVASALVRELVGTEAKE